MTAASETQDNTSCGQADAKITAGELAEALPLAQRCVEIERQASEQGSLELAEALTRLAATQYALHDYSGAEAGGTEAVRLTEKLTAPSNVRLIIPLKILGYTYAATDRHELAVNALDRAVLLIRRNDGIFSTAQQEPLKALADSLTELGRLQEALNQLLHVMRINERLYGENDPRIVPARDLIANWHAQTGDIGSARALYRESIDLVERRAGKNDPALVAPLRGLARTYTRELQFYAQGIRPVSTIEEPLETNPSYLGPLYIEHPQQRATPRTLGGEGELALQRSVAILNSSPGTPRQLLAETIIQQGDWYQIKGRVDLALKNYQKALSLDGSNDAGPESDGALSYPVQLYYPLPSSAIRLRHRPEEEVDERYVQVEFTVAADGAVKDAVVTDKDASDTQADQTLHSLRSARYRPRFLDGQPVDTTGVRIRQTFRVRKDS